MQPLAGGTVLTIGPARHIHRIILKARESTPIPYSLLHPPACALTPTAGAV